MIVIVVNKIQNAETSRHELELMSAPTESSATIIEEKKSQFFKPEAHALNALFSIE